MSVLGDRALNAYEESLARLVLATIVEATPHLGRPPSRGYAVSVLTGSASREILATDGHRIATYGALSGQRTLGLLLVDRLLERGLLESIQGRRGVVLTASGREVVQGNGLTVGLGVVPGAVSVQAIGLAVRSGLVDALRRFRAERAFEREIPEHRVFSEAKLREIATRLPVSRAELTEIGGLTDKLIDLESDQDALLRIVAEHRPIVERLRSA